MVAIAYLTAILALAWLVMQRGKPARAHWLLRVYCWLVGLAGAVIGLLLFVNLVEETGYTTNPLSVCIVLALLFGGLFMLAGCRFWDMPQTRSYRTIGWFLLMAATLFPSTLTLFAPFVALAVIGVTLPLRIQISIAKQYRDS